MEKKISSVSFDIMMRGWGDLGYCFFFVFTFMFQLINLGLLIKDNPYNFRKKRKKKKV